MMVFAFIKLQMMFFKLNIVSNIRLKCKCLVLINTYEYHLPSLKVCSTHLRSDFPTDVNTGALNYKTFRFSNFKLVYFCRLLWIFYSMLLPQMLDYQVTSRSQPSRSQVTEFYCTGPVSYFLPLLWFLGNPATTLGINICSR